MDTTYCEPEKCMPRLTDKADINTFWKVIRDDDDNQVTAIAYTPKGIMIINHSVITDVDTKESIPQYRIYNAIEVCFDGLVEITEEQFVEYYHTALDELEKIFVA